MLKYFFIIFLSFWVVPACADETEQGVQTGVGETSAIHSIARSDEVLEQFDHIWGKSRTQGLNYARQALNNESAALLYQLYFSAVLIANGEIQALDELKNTQFAVLLELDEFADFSLSGIFFSAFWEILGSSSQSTEEEVLELKKKRIHASVLEESLIAPDIYRRILLYPEEKLSESQLEQLRTLKLILIQASVSRSYEDKVLSVLLSVLSDETLTDDIAALVLSHFSNDPEAADFYIKVSSMTLGQLNVFLEHLMVLLSDEYYAGESHAAQLLSSIRRPEAFNFLEKETQKEHESDVRQVIYRSILNIKSDQAYSFIAERLLKVEAGNIESDILYQSFFYAFNTEWIYPRLHQKILITLLEQGDFAHISFYGEILFHAADNSKRHLQLIEEVQRRHLSKKLLKDDGYKKNAPFYKYLLLEGVSSAILENNPELAKSLYYESQKLDIEAKSFYQFDENLEDYEEGAAQNAILTLHHDLYVSKEVSLLLSDELERILKQDLEQARAQECPYRYLSDRLLGEITNTYVAYRLFENAETGEVVFEDYEGWVYYFDGYTLAKPPFDWLVFGEQANNFNILIALMDGLEWLAELPDRFLGKTQERPYAMHETTVLASYFYENLPPFTASVLQYEDSDYLAYIREYNLYGNILLLNTNLDGSEDMRQYVMRFPDTQTAQAYFQPLRNSVPQDEELQQNVAWKDNRDQLEKNNFLLVRGYAHPEWDEIEIIAPIDKTLLTQRHEEFFCNQPLKVEDIHINEQLFRQRELALYRQGYQPIFMYPAFNCRAEKVWDQEKTLLGKITRELEERGHEELVEQLLKDATKTRHYSLVLEDSIPIGKSKLGGLPDLPANVAWPAEMQDDNKKDEMKKSLQFIAQLNFAEFNADKQANYLPSRGLLSLFRSRDSTHSYEDNQIHALYIRNVNHLLRRELPKGRDNKHAILDKPMRLFFANDLSIQYPYRELLQDLYEEDFEAAEEYERVLMQYEQPDDELYVNYPEQHVFGYSSINHGFGGIFDTDKQLLIDLPIAGETLGIQLMEALHQTDMDVDIHSEWGY